MCTHTKQSFQMSNLKKCQEVRIHAVGCQRVLSEKRSPVWKCASVCATRAGSRPHLYEVKKGCSTIFAVWLHLSILGVWNKKHRWNHWEAGKSRTDVWKLQGATAAVSCPVGNVGGVCSRLPERMVTQKQASLYKHDYHCLQRGCGNCAAFFMPNPFNAKRMWLWKLSYLLWSPPPVWSLYIHRLWSSPETYCRTGSSPRTAPYPRTCSPPHTRTSNPTCLCSSESPSNEILGQKDNR